jgi:hypothetical protein
VRRLLRLALVLGATFLGPAATAYGDQCAFDTSSGDDWHIPSNWTCGHVPTDADDVAISGTTSNIIRVQAAAVARTLDFNGATLTFSNNVLLTVKETVETSGGTLTGVGRVLAERSFVKAGPGELRVADGARLLLPTHGLILGGRVCLAQAAPSPNPNEQAQVLVGGSLIVGSGAANDALGCPTMGQNGARVLVFGGASLSLRHGSLDLVGNFQIGGSLVIPSSSSVTCDVDCLISATILQIDGSLDCSGCLISGGLVQINGGLDCSAAPPGPPITAGALGGSGLADCSVVLDNGATVFGGLTVGGTISAIDATVNVSAGTTLTTPLLDIDEGVIQGAGTIVGDVVNENAIVRPGDSPGTLTIDGDYTQGTGGVLEAEVGASGHDELVVTGTATLDGRLRALPENGFDPALTDTFRVLTAGARSGTFATVDSGSLPGSKSFGVDYPSAPAGARLTVRAPAAAPPPSQAPAPPPAEQPQPQPQPVPPPPAPTPPPPPGPTPADLLAARTPGQIAGAFGLPGTRRCQSRRRFQIRLREPDGVDIAGAVLTYAGRRSRARFVDGRWRATVDLRGLPRGRITVRIVVTTTTGKMITGVRRYRPCATTPRRGRVPPV